MVINNNPNLNAKYSTLETFKSNRVKPQTTVKQEPEIDQVEIKEEQPDQEPKKEQAPQYREPERPKKKNRSIVQGFKNVIAGIKKFGVATYEYTIATGKGLFYGAIAAAGVLGVDAGVGIYKLAKDSKGNLSNILKEGAENIPKELKILSTKGKIGAALAGIGTIGYHWFRASLNVSEKSAAIDHRWGSGHDEVKD